ncbi:hypothetical protein N6H18_07320 [Reichenbachiella agarivorans]|uniref:Tetratricopeptide repeat-containing protein n=1 Tax=Reichenbachiella agarivorans TaxID=2979464 RepID=A0ABY6CTB4_9BACT|nr:hypothetical protein [Reichenbachiella agarivorans]UXP33762.1 hypothetical protein N6H18_07320 [Reichenbachiella agarivorans]
MNKAKLFLVFICFLAFTRCAPEKNNAFSNSYHNTTSHYNAYYIAKEDILAIEDIIEDSYQWNYNLILPVFPPFDSVIAQSYQEQIEHCIKKASLAIQMHRGSNWEDNAYILVGKARFYSLDFVNAIETFKYVNTKGKGDDEKHEALVALMRTFIEDRQFNNAIAVSDYLKRENLNKKNLKNLYLVRGYLYQMSNDLDNMVKNLTQAVPIITVNKERSRVNFIIGQVYQTLGFEAEAYSYYKEVLRDNPSYELSFYTKLNMAQVSQIGKSDDFKKVRKYFKKLLKDRKNIEYKDKIYYEMAQFEVRHGNLELGMDHYNSSIQASVNNNRQKAHSYWELGKIYYDSLADYEMAKLYYDSTMSVLPTDEIEYEAIAERLEVLTNFVEQLTIIHTNDSLLYVASLPEAALDTYLDEYIAREEAAELKRAEEEKKRKKQADALAAQQVNDPFATQGGAHTFGTTNYEGTLWYFYNVSAVSRGKSQFRTIWGDRPLEDNWRRSTKPANLVEENSDDANPNQNNAQTNPSEENKNEDSQENTFKIDKKALIATLPNTPEKRAVLLAEIEVATYKLGNIYNFDLDEKVNSTEAFEELLRRFPETEYRDEVWYLLYLIFDDLGNSTRSNYYKNLLLNQSPESIYAKLIINPNYRAESQMASDKLQVVYAEAYALYKAGNYSEALQLIDAGLQQYPDNNFVDNMAFLKVLVNARTETIYKYEFDLNNFIKEYPESELVPHADSLVYASEQYQINLVNSSRAKYISKFNEPHFFVFVYETDPELANSLPTYFAKIAKDNKIEINIGNLVLDEKHSIILLSEFPDKQSAVHYNQLVSNQKPSEKINKSGKFYNFVITKDNFNIFYQTKELDTYLTFYLKNYPAK